MKPVRLLPLLALAAVCLFTLKSAGLLLGDGYVLSGSAPAEAQAERPAPAPAARDAGQEEAASEQAAKRQEARAGEAANAGAETPAPETAARKLANASAAATPAEDPMARAPSADAPIGAEKDVLVSLAERRRQLDARARELDLRENLIKVAENRVESRIKELKAIENRIESQLARRDKEQDAEYEKLVSLYAKMKPKDAARIFEQMGVSVLAGLIRRMNARTVSPILAEMDPVMAKRVTMEIASSGEGPTSSLKSLPKINGRNPG